MRRFVLAVAAAFAVALPAAQSARPTDGAWRVSSWQRQPLVEQQTPGGALADCTAVACVTNPTAPPPGCVWDADDYQDVSFAGSLDPGESVSFTVCLVADWKEHLSWVRSATDGVTVTLQVGPTIVSGATTACVLGPDYDHGSPLLPPVDGSNGGVGVFTDVTFTVTNTLHRKLRRASAAGFLGYEQGQPFYCELGAEFGGDPDWRVGSG